MAGFSENREIRLVVWAIMLCAQFVVHTLCGQNQLLIDSLALELEQEKENLQRVTLMVRIAGEYAKSDSANTYKYVNDAVTLSREIKYKEGEIDAWICLGTLEIEKGKYDSAMARFNRIVEMSEQAAYPIGKAKALRGMGHVSDYKGNYEAALDYFNQSLSIFKEAGEEADMALCISFISGVKRMQGDYSQALEYGLKSLHMYEKLDDTPGVGLISNDVGLIYWNLGDLDKALEYFEKSLAIHEKLQDKRSIAYTTANMGVICEEKTEPEKALAYYNKSLEMLYELNDKRALAIILYNVSVVYKSQEQFKLSLDHGFKSLKLREELGVESEKSYPLVGIGRTYMEMERWQKAKSYLKQGYEVAKLHGMRRVEQEALLDLSRIEGELGNYKSAYKYHVLYKQAADSLINEENTKQITRLEAEYEFQKEKDSIQFENEKSLLAKNTEIELLNEKEKVSRLRLLALVCIAIFILASGYFIARSKVREKEAQTKSLQEIGKFKEAMTGMIAHDLKNPLSIILNNQDVEKNQHTARQMLQLINNMLDVQKFEAARMPLELKQVDLNALVETAIDQVGLLATQSNISIEKEIPTAEVNVDPQILERVLMNLLTNAIKFAPNNSTITINGEEVDGSIRLSVSDQGKGIAKEDQAYIFESFGQLDPRMSGGVGSTGLGLTFCKLAIEAHGSKLELESARNEGTTFWFDLRLESKTTVTEDSQSPTRYLTMEANEQEKISAVLPALKKLNLYQIGEIEKELASINQEKSESVNQWVDAILDAAYSGNQEEYDALLEKVQMPS